MIKRIFYAAIISVFLPTMLSAQINITANYDSIIVQTINPIVYGVSAHGGKGGFVNNTIYRGLVEELGGVTLHIPSSANKSKWNMLTGTTAKTPHMTLSELKQFSDDCGGKVRIYPIVSWKLYASRELGGDGLDIREVILWLKNSGWPLEYWQYWKIGSEVYGDWDAEYIPKAAKYGAICKEIFAKMKEVEPNLKCGISGDIMWSYKWNGIVLDSCKNLVDFVDFHHYPHDKGGGINDYTAALDVMGQEPFIRTKLLPAFKKLFAEKTSGRQLEILFSEYDFWGMDHVSTPYFGRNTTLADALAWGDQIGYCLKLGIHLGGGYYFAGGGSYGMLPGWERGEMGDDLNNHRPIIYSPKTWAIALWQKHFGTTMVECTINNSPTYTPLTGRAGWANVDDPSSDYRALPVPFITGYAGMDTERKRASLVIINKHNTSSYSLNVSVTGAKIDSAKQTDVYTLTTRDPKGLLAWQDRYEMGTKPYQQIFPPAHTTTHLSSKFCYKIGPHSMVVVSMPIETSFAIQTRVGKN
jgi:hypothetical protein